MDVLIFMQLSENDFRVRTKGQKKNNITRNSISQIFQHY